jgi:AraC-like DNA-binding protein
MKLPLWLRFFLLIGVAVFAAGAGLLAYRYYTRPATLTVAVGSIDGEAAKAMSAIASELASTNAPVRLEVIDCGTALEAANAFSAGTPDILELPEIRRALEQQLIHVMVRCLADGARIETTTGGRRHDAIVAGFEEFLTANPDRPLYLTEICAAIGVAERSLRASCEEHLGMGPIRFLTLRRMHLVHRALRHADPSDSTGTRIVTDHGFCELGRFSVAYRELFGESPSATLRRPPEHLEPHFNHPSSLPVSSMQAA